MEGSVSTSIPTVLDLSCIEASERASLWMSRGSILMPGLSIANLPHLPTLGLIRQISLGGGRLWFIQSAPVIVHYTPVRHQEENAPNFSLMLQLDGTLAASQKKRETELKPGDLCLIDGSAPFRLHSTTETQMVLLQLPRKSCLSRHPNLEHGTAVTFEPHGPGTTILRNTLLNLLQAAPFLNEEQRATALAGVIQLLGLPEMPRTAVHNDMDWRVRAALAYIETRFSDTGLVANHVATAQGISRRWLDEIFRETVGMSLTAQIWTRRLMQSAHYLTDPQHAKLTVAQIAYATGFEDPSHFTRAFKRQFGQTPGQWREAGAAPN